MRNLQKHRIKAFRATLDKVKDAATGKKVFLEEYRDVYKFPKRRTDKNISEYKKLIKAIEKIQAFDLEIFR